MPIQFTYKIEDDTVEEVRMLMETANYSGNVIKPQNIFVQIAAQAYISRQKNISLTESNHAANYTAWF